MPISYVIGFLLWAVASFLLGILVLFLQKIGLFLWSPKKGIWYRNKIKYFNMGHAANETNCYVVIHGKKIRGSFKVIGDRVRYILGWKYRRNSIKEIPKKYCSFRKTYDTHVCIGQGDMDKKIWTYMMTIKN